MSFSSITELDVNRRYSLHSKHLYKIISFIDVIIIVKTLANRHIEERTGSMNCSKNNTPKHPNTVRLKFN